MSETPIPVEILYWHYPDSVEKMVMNDLVKNNSISKKKFQDEVGVAPTVEMILDVFEDNGYVTSTMAVDPSDGLTYKRWTVTPFFLSRIQAQRNNTAEQDAIKMALWNQKNQLMAAALKGGQDIMTARTATAAAGAAPMEDGNLEGEITESDINDRIMPEQDALKRKMQEEFDEKRRLKRLQEEGDENKI